MMIRGCYNLVPFISRAKPFLRAVRRKAVRGALASGVVHLGQSLTGRRHFILTFHRIRPAEQPLDPFDTCPNHSIDMFRRLLEYVTDHFDIVPLRELVERGSRARKAVAITFDDGWRDNFDLAFPVLKRLGLPATIFVTTGKIGASQPFWQQVLGGLFRQAVDLSDRDRVHAIKNALGLDDQTPMTPHVYRSIVQDWKGLGVTDCWERERFRFVGAETSS